MNLLLQQSLFKKNETRKISSISNQRKLYKQKFCIFNMTYQKQKRWSR